MNYRVLLLHSGGVVKTFFDIVAHDDAEALAMAKSDLGRDQSFELWSGSRLVHSDRPPPKP